MKTTHPGTCGCCGSAIEFTVDDADDSVQLSKNCPTHPLLILSAIPDDVREKLLALHKAAQPAEPNTHGLDTTEQVLFYEQDFYVLSNFSAFAIEWDGRQFATSEHAYHYEKFPHEPTIRYQIQRATSAHEALKIAERNKAFRRDDWEGAKVGTMHDILRAKVQQHEYVHRKLLATGDRELIENSWRDNFWGWGPNRDGFNMLGKLWMQVRAEIRSA